LNVFIVFAHNLAPNGALKDLAVLTLKKKRREVIVSDLYGMGFKINIIKKMQLGLWSHITTYLGNLLVLYDFI
jgi:putative NADPH-quinone reductase